MRGKGTTDGSCRMVFIRHGHTVIPVSGMVLAGWTDLPLSELGECQARALRPRLQLTPEDILYSSPLCRARHTAELLEPPVEIRLEEDLREIHCGALEGVALREVQSRHRDLWAANEARADPAFRWPGGESYSEFRDRAVGAVEEIARRHPGGRVVVVTHCGVISQILGWLQGGSPARWDVCRPGNASITELHWNGARPEALLFDDRAHLAVC